MRGLIGALLLVLALGLAGCGLGGERGIGYQPGAPAYAPTHYYPPPGPAGDPWGPYIDAAAVRFAIPGAWIRAVMAQESGGEEQAVSPTGAMGLMQIEPATYQDLQAQYGLGDDPFDPRDNVLAGAAYIKQMYDRYGAPGFLAAYNAGPNRLDDYIANGTKLPDETVNYLAAVTPNLGGAVAFSGPLARYASAGGGLAPTVVGFATGCDVNAAYDPNHPCDEDAAPAPPVAVATNAGACDADTAYDPVSPCAATAGGAGACDADRAYEPADPCHAGLAPILPAAPVSTALYSPAATPPPVMVSDADWSVQVGAFSAPALARAVAEGARAEAPDALASATLALPATTPFGGHALYRAQLTGLTPAAAIRACARLNARQLPCVVLPGA